MDSAHWTLAVIFITERKIQYYDSCGGTDENTLKGLLRYLKEEHKAKKGKELEGEWTLEGCPEDLPRQTNGEEYSSHFYVVPTPIHRWNLLTFTPVPLLSPDVSGYDCGVFICLYSYFILLECPLVFTQAHVSKCREWLALSVLKNL